MGVDLIGYTVNQPGLVDVSCSFSAPAGQGTIPGEALAGSPSGDLTIYQEQSNAAQVGSFHVELAARNLGGGGPGSDGGTCPSNNAPVTYR